VSSLHVRERPSAGEPQGTLVLLHGRGADEHDLYPLLDALDPERRLYGVTPRGPLSLPPGGAHWYQLGGIPTPDPDTFRQSFELLSGWLDGLQRPLVLGGFSQGAVMSWALGLGRGPARRPAAIVALSGFMPRVDRFDLDLSDLQGYPAAIGHGTYDDIISVEFSREARSLLEAAGASVLYREYPLPHTIDPAFIPELQAFVAAAVDAK
jgi:phospholipase/carboxylesterase